MTPKPGGSGEICNFKLTLFLARVTDLPCASVEDMSAKGDFGCRNQEQKLCRMADVAVCVHRDLGYFMHVS